MKIECLVCKGNMIKLPGPENQAGLGTAIDVYVCEECGDMRQKMNLEMAKDYLEGFKNDDQQQKG